LKAEISFSPEIITAIAQEVAGILKPILKGLTPPLGKIDDLMSVESLGAYLGGVSLDWIYQRTAKNEIPFVKVGRLLKFRRTDIDRWLSARSVPAVAPLSAPYPGRRTRDSQSDEGDKTHRKIV